MLQHEPVFKLSLGYRTDERIQTLTPEEHVCWFRLLCMAGADPELFEVPLTNLPRLALRVSGGSEGTCCRRAISKLARWELVHLVEDPHRLVFPGRQGIESAPTQRDEGSPARTATGTPAKVSRFVTGCHSRVTASHRP